MGSVLPHPAAVLSLHSVPLVTTLRLPIHSVAAEPVGAPCPTTVSNAPDPCWVCVCLRVYTRVCECDV